MMRWPNPWRRWLSRTSADPIDSTEARRRATLAATEARMQTLERAVRDLHLSRSTDEVNLRARRSLWDAARTQTRLDDRHGRIARIVDLTEE